MPDLKDELQALADRRTAEAGGDFAAVLDTARGRRRRRTAGWTAAVLTAACAVVAGTSLLNGADPVAPADGTPGERSLVLTPSTVRAGESLVAALPEGESRKLLFSLVPVDGSPPASFYLLARAPGDSRDPAWWLTTQEIGSGVVPDYSGPGPFDLRVPDRAAPGSYKVCNQELCGLLTVRD